MLSALTAFVLAASITNTESVHALAPLGDHVVACTEGGLEVFSTTGVFERTLHVEDGLPSHFCHALQPVGEVIFACVDDGVVMLDGSFSVRQVVRGVRWLGLPPPQSAGASSYELQLRQLASELPNAATFTAFSGHFASSADGQIVDRAHVRVAVVPGFVLALDERASELHIVTSESSFVLRDGALTKVTSGRAPLGVQHADSLIVLTNDGHLSRWNDARTELAIVGPPALTAFLELPEGQWFGTRSDGVHFRAKGSRSLKRVTPTNQICSNHIVALTRHRGRLVVGTFERGVCWQDGTRWTSFRVPALPSNQVFDVASDGMRLWVATSNGLGLWDGAKWTQYAFGARNPIGLQKLSVAAVLPRLNAGIAVVDGRGVSVLEPTRTLALKARIAYPADWSTHLSAAAGKGTYLWVGSENRGVLRFDGTEWTSFHDGRDLTDNWVTTIDADAQGRAVVGSCQDGFSYFDGTTWTRMPARQMVVSSALLPTGSGALVGTMDGAFRFDAGTKTLSSRIEGLADQRVYAFLVEGQHVLVGTEGGLSTIELPMRGEF